MRLAGPRLVLFALCCCLFASQAFAAISIEGRVINAVTNEAVPGAELKLTCLVESRLKRLCKEMSATTLADGTFRFDLVFPFKYHLKALAGPGLVATRLSEIDADFSARRSSSLTNVVLKLFPESTITGRVLDETGQPKPDVMVEALRQSVTGVGTQVAFISKALSNEKGVYTLRSLPSGNYYVATPIPHEDKNDTVNPYLFFAPDTLSLDQATLTHVDTGQNNSGIDFHLRPVFFYRLQGRAQMETSGSNPSDQPQLHLDARDNSGVSLPSRDIILNRDGTFQTDVLPGSYTFRLTGALTLPQAKTSQAQTQAQAGPTVHLLARQDIEVSGKDLMGIILLIPPPITVTGHAYLEGPTETDLPKGKVTIKPVDADAIGGPQTADIQPDGTFVFTNCDPASYLVRFLPPPGAYVKSLEFNKQDALTHPMDLSRGSGGELTIVLHPGTATLAGSLLDPAGVPDAGGEQKAFDVTLISDLWEENGVVPVRHATGKDGRFSFTGIPPGHYSAIATTGVEMRFWENAKFVHEMQSRGVAVDLAENDQKQLAVPYLTYEEIDQLQFRLGIN